MSNGFKGLHNYKFSKVSGLYLVKPESVSVK